MWVVVTAEDPSKDFDESILDRACSAKDLIVKFKH